MKQEDWTKRLYDRLADHESSAPADLWADIEARLATEQEAPRRPVRIVPLWTRWAAAAAFVGVLAGGGYLLWHKEAGIQVDKEIAVATVRQKVATASQDEPLPSVSATPDEPKPAAIASASSAEPGDVLAALTHQDVQPAETTPAIEPSASENTALLSDTIQPEEILSPQAVVEVFEQMLAEAGRSSSGSVSLDLYASNGFGNQQSANGVLMSPSMLSNYAYSHSLTRTRGDSDDPVYLYNYGERQKNYQPVSFGLTVNVPVTPSLSVVTGVVYTRLRSDFIYDTPSFSQTKEQTLHYVGVPVALRYRLWHTGGLHVYASAGAQADYNVKARLTTDGVHQQMGRDNWQFSVSGALGLQYDVIPRVGVYAEPGVKHYFDNGTRVSNFFKEKPTSFNLELGLRLNLY